MTVALNDVVLLSTLFHPSLVPDLSSTNLVLKQMRTFPWRRKNLTAVINILAQALYSLFAANDPYLRVLQKGCFRYFQLGGQCIDGPVGLLAGITRQPFVLLYHFFSVALLSIWIMLCESPVWKLPLACLQGVAVFLESVCRAVSVYWCGVEGLIGRTRIYLLSMIVIQAARHWAAVNPAKSCFTSCYSVNVHWLIPHPSAAVVILGSEKRRSCMQRPCPEDQSQVQPRTNRNTVSRAGILVGAPCPDLRQVKPLRVLSRPACPEHIYGVTLCCVLWSSQTYSRPETFAAPLSGH